MAALLFQARLSITYEILIQLKQIRYFSSCTVYTNRCKVKNDYKRSILTKLRSSIITLVVHHPGWAIQNPFSINVVLMIVFLNILNFFNEFLEILIKL